MQERDRERQREREITPAILDTLSSIPGLITIRINKLLLPATIWMKLTNIVLNERKQTRKTTNCVTLLGKTNPWC